MNSLQITIPLVPPGFNHYVRHTRAGRHYRTREATAFKDALAVIIAGRAVFGEAFHVEATVYLGAGAKGDVDGFGKLILDGLAGAGVFQKPGKRIPTVRRMSDAHVTELILRKRRDRENPRTEITISAGTILNN